MHHLCHSTTFSLSSDVPTSSLSVASLIGFIHKDPFQTANHPLRSLLLHSSSLNCHVFYRGLCAVALRQHVSLAFETRLQRNEAEVKLNSGTRQSQKAIQFLVYDDMQ